MIFRKFSTTTRTLAKVIPKNLKGKSVSSQLWLQRQLSDPYVEKARMLNYRCEQVKQVLCDFMNLIVYNL